MKWRSAISFRWLVSLTRPSDFSRLLVRLISITKQIVCPAPGGEAHALNSSPCPHHFSHPTTGPNPLASDMLLMLF